ncbi:MAG: plasmid mobilization protein [Bacteroidota bacterium]
MEKNKIHRARTMSVRYNDNDITRLKMKAQKEGLDVSTYVRHISLKSLKNE